MERFRGRVAIVTGASSGIGAAVAEALVREGMEVVGAARRVQRIQDLANRLKGKSCGGCGGWGRLHAVQVDVSSEEDVHRLYQWAEHHLHDAPAVVVNCAGVAKHQATQDLEAGDISCMINTNIGGVMCSCREAVNCMKRRAITDGHIININSIGGHYLPVIPGISFSVYCGTKFALTAFCQGLRSDVKKLKGFQIRVTSISPGSVATEMMDDPLWTSLASDGAPVAMLSPKDISDTVIFALSSPPQVEIVELTVQPTNETC